MSISIRTWKICNQRVGTVETTINYYLTPLLVLVARWRKLYRSVRILPSHKANEQGNDAEANWLGQNTIRTSLQEGPHVLFEHISRDAHDQFTADITVLVTAGSR